MPSVLKVLLRFVPESGHRMHGGTVILVGLFALALTVGSNAEGETTPAPGSDVANPAAAPPAAGPIGATKFTKMSGLLRARASEPASENDASGRGNRGTNCFVYQCGHVRGESEPCPEEGRGPTIPCPGQCHSAIIKGRKENNGIEFRSGGCGKDLWRDGCRPGQTDSGFVGTAVECLCSTDLCNGVESTERAVDRSGNGGGGTGGRGGASTVSSSCSILTLVIIVSLMSS